MSALTMLASTAAEVAGEQPDIAKIIIGHVVDSSPWAFGWSKFVLMLCVAAVLTVFGIYRAVRGYDADGVPRTRWAQMLDPFVEHFYRDVALQYCGKKWASRVAPLILTFFFFILTCNLLGLVPASDMIQLGRWLTTGGGVVSFEGGTYFKHGGGEKAAAYDAEAAGAGAAEAASKAGEHEYGALASAFSALSEGGMTATANYTVTATLAIVAFFAIIIFGVRQHGLVGHFAHLAPKGPPFVVRWFLLLPIETISMFVKPFALTMRLAANMTAGHMGILALMVGFIYAAQAAGLSPHIGGFPAALLATAIMLLEIVVSFVQAYVFALLTGVFIGMAVSDHH